MELIKRYKIIFSLVTALIITLIISKTIFFEGIPKINAEKIRRTIKNTQDNLIIFKNTFAYKLSPNKIDYEKVFSDDVPAVEFVQGPEITNTPIPTPTIIPTEIPEPSPTPIPTLIPVPTEIILTKVVPTVHRLPTVVPTKKKKSKPTPIPIATPEEESFSKISSPLDQPYYKPGLAYKCYNADKFIEVYANGVSSANCYSKVQSVVNSNLTSVSILGKSITVNKKAYSAFKAVSDELSKNSVAKKYKINTIGAYIFRCNVNASTSGRNDLCSNGCVLSTHSFGIAVDINWEENCNGCSSYTMPMEIVDIFESYGFRWGGRYKSVFGSRIDPMHFEYMYDLCKDLK